MDAAALVETLLIGWEKNEDYASRLVVDLDNAQMVAQPAPNMNHPAWTFSHLNAYHPVLVALLQGEDCDDPKDHPFGMQSKPEGNAAVYLPKGDLLATFRTGHQSVADALTAADEAALAAPIPIERWKTVFPKVSSCLGYLMLVHESTHLGQLSAWRRVQGLPSV